MNTPQDHDALPPTGQPGKPPSRKKLVLFALMLAAMSLFMYVSFIVKTAVKGP